MALDVRYLRGTAAQYQAYLDNNRVVDYYYYLIKNLDDTWDLYLGKVKLSNERDFQTADEALSSTVRLLSAKIEEMGVPEGKSVQDMIDDSLAGGSTTVAADELSVTNDNGLLKLRGFDAAMANTYPRKASSGELEWVGINEIVDGATENTITTGDNVSIVATGAPETGYIVSLKGVDSATSGQVPFYSETTDEHGAILKTLVWKDTYTKEKVDEIIDPLNTKIISLETTLNGSAEDPSAGLISQVGANAEGIAALEENTYTKAEVDAALNAALSWQDME